MVSTSSDPFYNAALEDLLLDRADDHAPLLLLYTNRACVVTGKNQVPWRECQTGLLGKGGPPLVRRISGGGTVYHDEGNLNYSFILPREGYRQQDVLNILTDALDALDITASVGPHNSLVSGGAKISGTAFCFRRNHLLHHGTMLVNADLARLRSLCRAALGQIETRAIASQPAHVDNLSTLVPGTTIEAVSDALIRQVERSLGSLDVEEPMEDAEVNSRRETLAAWDHVYGASPDFTVQFPATGVRLVVHRGCVERAEGAAPDLTGCPFERQGLLRQCANSPLGAELAALDF